MVLSAHQGKQKLSQEQQQQGSERVKARAGGEARTTGGNGSRDSQQDPSTHALGAKLRPADLPFEDFKGLAKPPHDLESWWQNGQRCCTEATSCGASASLPYMADAYEPTNILFSSGTTGEPKAIAWTHVTPVRCFADGWAHQDIKPGIRGDSRGLLEEIQVDVHQDDQYWMMLGSSG